MREPPTYEIPQLLLELGIPAHRVGFKYLCIAFLYFTKGNPPFFTKELYPFVAKSSGATDWRAVEHGIRQVIYAGWKHGNKALWNKYFPGVKRPPSNKQFIATITEYI